MGRNKRIRTRQFNIGRGMASDCGISFVKQSVETSAGLGFETALLIYKSEEDHEVALLH
jgi:hypothetical protein